jgi:hypothetical protein
MSDLDNKEEPKSPGRISRLSLIVTVVAIAFAAWIIILSAT